VKELLQAFLPDYLRIVEPDLVDHLDFASLSFRDVEGLAPDLQDLVVAEVSTCEKERATVLVLIAAEAPGPRDVARRLKRLFDVLEIRLGRPVLMSFLLFRGGRPGVNLETAPVSALRGLANVQVYYTAFSLEGSTAEYYLERPEPLAWALAAWMPSRRLDRSTLLEACRERIRAADLELALRRLLLDAVAAFP